MRTIAAMSGGVDSAVAAALLLRAGRDVEGVTLRLANLSSRGLGASRCCSVGDVELAARVCWQLGIPHRVIDLGADFEREVLDPFVESYLAGQTPSPCPRCNSRVKLGPLLGRLEQLGASGLATGHYARIEGDERGRARLLRGLDAGKDQSYYLFELRPEQLASVVLPLGSMTKSEVRALARELGIASADRPDSQEMCFIPPNGSYIDVLDALAGDRLGGPGAIVDTAGRMLGEHRGIYRFTIGQRRGLNLPGARPFYVTAIDAANNTIVVGGQDDLVRRGITLRNTIWHDDELPTRFDAEVQVRYRHHPQPATVQRGVGGSATVEFPNGVMAPATGQAAVCYRGELVLGGGWIDSTE